MNPTGLILSMLFGTVGMGFLMYAKNAGKLVPVAAGVALLVLPYFISNTALLVIVCLALSAAPFVWRDA